MELTNNSASSSGRARPRPLIAGASLIKAPKSELTNDAARRPPKFRANNKKKKCGRIRRGRGDGPGRNRNRYQFLNWTRALKNNILAWQSKYLANPPWEMCPSRRLPPPAPRAVTASPSPHHGSLFLRCFSVGGTFRMGTFNFALETRTDGFYAVGLPTNFSNQLFDSI